MEKITVLADAGMIKKCLGGTDIIKTVIDAADDEIIISYCFYDSVPARTAAHIGEMCTHNINIDGRKDPEKLLKAADNWNRKVIKAADDTIDYLQEAKNEGYNADEMQYLRLTADIMGKANVVQFGSQYAVMNTAWNVTAMLSEKDKKNIKEHPENWIIFDIHYPSVL